jgi:hypothetical protein
MNGTSSPSGFAGALGSLPSGWKALASADVTNDGRAEVFIQDGNTGSIYTYNLAASQWAVATASLTSDWELVGVGDVTRDGVADIVIRDDGNGTVVFGDLNAGGAFGFWGAVANVGLGWRAAGVGDFDRDGRSDVLFQNVADGTTYYRSVATQQWGFVSGAIGSDWIAKEAADLNGDGYFDVVFQNQATGDVWYVNMLGGAHTGAGWGVVANGLAGWDVRGTADVDNDGYLDVLVQNAGDGTTYYADMNNGGFAGWGAVTGALGTDWVVA